MTVEKMIIADLVRLRAAGMRLAVAALRVVETFDGTHRLARAAGEWALTVAGEGGRSPAPPLFVLMGNDYPGGVFSTREVAEQEAGRRTAIDRREGRQIHWRVYEHELDSTEHGWYS